MARPIGSASLPSPMVITPCCRLSLGGAFFARMAGTTAPATGASPWSAEANSILAYPFVLEATTTFYKGFWLMGSAGGTVNREIGIWDEFYNKIVTTGAVAGNNTNSVPQSAAFTATVTLPAGRYYAGMGYAATTTNTNCRWSGNANYWQQAGCWKQAGITLGSLAATATPADISNVAFPTFGLITRSVFDV